MLGEMLFPTIYFSISNHLSLCFQPSLSISNHAYYTTVYATDSYITSLILQHLLSVYQGRGERSIEDSANLVGLSLPDTSTSKETSEQQQKM